MFGPLVIGYLFLGGAGAGASVLTAALGLLAPREYVAGRLTQGCGGLSSSEASRSHPGRPFVLSAPSAYRRLLAPAFGIACFCLVVGALMLVCDLGVCERVGLLFTLPSMTFVTVGAFSLVALAAVSFLLALAWGLPHSIRWNYSVVRAMMWLCLVLGLIVMVYTGLLLAAMPAVPFWSSPLVPVLLSASALSCGCALVFACAGLSGSSRVFSNALKRIVVLDVAAIVVEVVSAAALVAVALANPYQVAQLGAQNLLVGESSALFLAGFVGAGLVVPFALESGMLAARRYHVVAAYVAAAGVLVGGLALRCCIVAVGAHPEVWTVIS